MIVSLCYKKLVFWQLSLVHNELDQGSFALWWDRLVLDWMWGPPAPMAVLELMACKYVKACKCVKTCRLQGCACLTNNFNFTEMCKIQTCTNQRGWRRMKKLPSLWTMMMMMMMMDVMIRAKLNKNSEKYQRISSYCEFSPGPMFHFKTHIHPS